MDLDTLIQEIAARGGECVVWLVYLTDRNVELEGGPPALVLQSAFFTRGEAYACAEAARKARMWQHFYVFGLQADVAWVTAGFTRTGEFEMAFGRTRDLPNVSVTPTDVAAAMTT